MSEAFIRCVHCGLPHERYVVVCPTTGLRIEQHERLARRRARRRPDAPERIVGWVLGEKYRVLRLIGQGGMSAIYEADHIGSGGRVAIKVIHPALADDPEAIARLRHEALVVSAIGHPNICAVYDLGRTPDGSPYLAMERLIGESLGERIQSFGPMSFGELAPLVLEVLAALGAAHGKGILHRDLKPENVFIVAGPDGRRSAKLLDFGISKSIGFEMVDQQRLTHSGMVMGTPYYMSPEQARGDSNLDQRVDLWAVGVLLYEALTGRKPFVATNYNALLVKILTSRPRPVQKIVSTIPDVVAALIDRALAKLREDRFQSADELARAIHHAHREVAAEDPHAPTMVIRRPRQHALADTRRDRAGRDWSLDIEDPETFIDDEPSPEEERLPRGNAARTRPVGSRAAITFDEQLATLDDEALAEPLEPTIQERLEDEPAREALGGGWEGGTEVMDGADTDRSYDDERTTFYDIEAAKAKLARRRTERPGPAQPKEPGADHGKRGPR